MTARFAFHAGLVLTALFSAGLASAAQLSCSGGSVSMQVDLDPSANTCAVDGQRASLRKAHDPVVCHLSTPQLSILTIERDGVFIWEDTSKAQVFRGTCVGI